jgi:hypothetical protein
MFKGVPAKVIFFLGLIILIEDLLLVEKVLKAKFFVEHSISNIYLRVSC